MATVKKKVKKAQSGIGCFKGQLHGMDRGPLIRLPHINLPKINLKRKNKPDGGTSSTSDNSGKAGPLSKGSMWHPNDPEIYAKDPSASYWQERDYNEGKGVAKKVGEALKKPIMKKGGKVAKAKSGKVIKSAPKKAAVKKSSKKK